MSAKTRIIGIGNPLCGDDGVGVVMVERLQKAPLPPEVEVIDGGLGGLTLIDYFEDVQRVILIDAADFSATPGEIALFDLSANPFTEDPSLQQLHAGLAPLLALVSQLELCPQVQLLAVQPCDTAVGQPLSPPVRSRLDQLESTLISLLS